MLQTTKQLTLLQRLLSRFVIFVSHSKPRQQHLHIQLTTNLMSGLVFKHLAYPQCLPISFGTCLQPPLPILHLPHSQGTFDKVEPASYCQLWRTGPKDLQTTTHALHKTMAPSWGIPVSYRGTNPIGSFKFI